VGFDLQSLAHPLHEPFVAMLGHDHRLALFGDVGLAPTLQSVVADDSPRQV